MESQRNFLVIALVFVSFLLFMKWQEDNAPQQAPVEQAATNPAVSTPAESDDFVPTGTTEQAAPQQATVANSQLIEVTTDTLAVKINTNGGDIVEAKLLQYNETNEDDSDPFTILQNGDHRYIAQSGLTGPQGIDRTVTGRPIYDVSASSFTLGDKESLTVDLTYVSEDGINVVKSFIFTRGHYDIEVKYDVTNNTAANATVQLYGQLKQATTIASRFWFDSNLSWCCLFNSRYTL